MTASSKPLLLLHGALGSSLDLKGLEEYLQALNYETFSFNFSGHGLDPVPSDAFRIESFALDLEVFFKKHQFTTIPVFGYSMGGYVALFHKAHFEDSPISHIVTYGTKFNWSATSVAKELPMLDPENIEEKYPAFANSLHAKHGPRWKHLLRSTAHMMQHLERLDGLTQEDLEDVHIPVTLIRGELDRMVTAEETSQVASWLSHSEIKLLAQSKHELERASIKDLAQFIDSALEK